MEPSASRKKNGEGLVGIELENRQVEPVGANQAQSHKAVEVFLDCGFLADDLVVELDTFLAGQAPQNRHDRFAGRFCLGLGFGEIVVDPEAFGLDFALVLADFLVAGLGRGGGGMAQQNRQCQRD